MQPRTMTEDHHEYLEIRHFTPTDFEKAGPAWPIRIGHNRAKPNYHIGPRTSPFYYLLFVLEGAGRFVQGGAGYPLRSGDMFGLFPHVTHEYITEPDEPLRKIFFAFDGSGAPHLLERIGLTASKPHAAGALRPEVVQQMWTFLDAAASPNMSDLMRLSHMYGIFDKLSEWSSHPADNGHKSAAWLQIGKEYMDIHFGEGITVEHVAAHVGVDRSHFTKRFRLKHGMAPVQYLQQLKMTEAKRLLGQTGYTVAEIAGSVGYPDLFSFSKAFKKRVGLSPAAYREAERGKRGSAAD
ncbi:helix-turn-helix domain-containing protein [Paenibacillus chartarius]|uniref:Helix-turn-helix domain-containing protein n=1 Tax=Paenibacillus chartarius TaxID=747481 RepID=A0ABV6DGK6_9BACL